MSDHNQEKLKQAIKDTGSYTPGPWKLFKSWDARPHAIFLRKGVAFIEVVHYGYSDHDEKISREQLANAHLISAAPDLLECQTMGGQLNTPDFLDWVADRLVHVYHENQSIDFVISLRDRAQAGRDAIAKATGIK